MFIAIAIEMLKSRNDVIFIIAGEGPKFQPLNQLIRKSNLQSSIILLGHVENIQELYSFADIFLSTSLWEGLPYTYLEAIYFNLPLIITPTLGIEYLKQYTEGVHIVPYDIQAFMKEINFCLDNGLVTSKYISEEHPFLFSRFLSLHKEGYQSLLTTKRN